MCSARADACSLWTAGELAGVSPQALGSQFGDSTAQWLYRLARGCDTEEVHTRPCHHTALSTAHIGTQSCHHSVNSTLSEALALIKSTVSKGPSSHHSVNSILSKSSLLCFLSP